MISLKNILTTIISETMTFADIFRVSDPKRKERSRHIKSRSLGVRTIDNDETWTFSYKSDPGWSTTGKRWHGYVRFLKENIKQNENAMDVDCIIDCECPDQRYRWAYRTAEKGASVVGPKSLSKNNGQPPKTINTDLGPGACKHILHLSEYLKTKIEPDAPIPPEEERKREQQPKVQQPTQKTPIASAPKPPEQKPQSSYYSDTRSGDILEITNKKSLYEKFKSFVDNNKEFSVDYYDDE